MLRMPVGMTRQLYLAKVAILPQGSLLPLRQINRQTNSNTAPRQKEKTAVVDTRAVFRADLVLHLAVNVKPDSGCQISG